MSGERRIKVGDITLGKTRGKKLADELARSLNAPKKNAKGK